ncbi:hypothetical protein RvY_02743 [Ramazzottius varieornatus]|uniref:Uncharacterized protein n=1 Tax=Ramazzottius varieornatus TaxID=947166 RepID=A0A1D1UVY1_RAMVA|nr:hypothetical protein RvY_02743 [Ramazzottius varieornatus]
MLAIFEHLERLFVVTGTERISAMKYLCRALEKFSLSELESYDNRELRWYFPQFDERPKPKVLSLLEAQEYWRKPAPERTQLRPGHDVYIRTKQLESIASYYGPQSPEKSTKKYSCALIVHMLGGLETARKLLKVAGSLRPLFDFDDLVAVCSHAEEIFQVMFCLNPNALIIYANSGIARYNKQQKRLARRATAKSTKNDDLLHLALNVS